MVYFVSLERLTHQLVKYKSYGASEYQFYNLVDVLQQYMPVKVFNNIAHKQIIDNVIYDNLNSLFEIKETDIDCIIQNRRYSLLTDINNQYNMAKLFPNTPIYLWTHDDVCDGVFGIKEETNEVKKVRLGLIMENSNIKFIFVSYSCCERYINYFNRFGYKLTKDKYRIIYNTVYDIDLISKIKENNIKLLQKENNYKYILYASSAQKGQDRIIDLLKPLLSNNNYKLVICNPHYSVYNGTIDEGLKDKIMMMGILDKEKYYSLLNSVDFIIAPYFFETFGCCFNEAEYFNIPVIFFEKSGAVKEICCNDGLVNFNINDIINFIEKYNRKTITIKPTLLKEYVIKQWKNLIDFHNKLDIEIGILSWKSYKTLTNTLESHQNNGLYNIIKKKTIYYQEIKEKDVDIAKKYNFNILGSPDNIGIMYAFLELIKNSKCKYFIFAENDFELVHNEEETRSILQDCINLLDNYNIDIVKLRDRKKPGAPLHSRPRLKEGETYENIRYSDNHPYQLESLHWLENPDKIFKNTLKKVTLSYHWFTTNQKYQRWSNNVFIAKSEWLKITIPNLIDTYLHQYSSHDVKYALLEKILIDHLNFTVAAGIGLFTHNRID